MRNKIIVTIVVCLLTSCAHKSGHKKLNGNIDIRQETSQRLSSNTDSSEKDVAAEYGANDEILDGKTIFSRFGRAVFMVFTTDGTNTYQGSGFFINSHGLAVSNYHVLKVQR